MPWAKAHVATHSDEDFVATNVTGTLVLLEAALAAGIHRFVFTSITSAFGAALSPEPGEPVAWIDESVTLVAKNIYGVTKTAAESRCELFHRKHQLPVVVLRTSRFFPEPDDNPLIRGRYEVANVQANEMLYRRAVDRFRALHRLGDDAALRRDTPAVAERLFPGLRALYAARGWSMFPSIDRVYDNARARADLGWLPLYDFAHVLSCLREGEDFRSALAQAVGSRGYHDTSFANRPYPVG